MLQKFVNRIKGKFSKMFGAKGAKIPEANRAGDFISDTPNPKKAPTVASRAVTARPTAAKRLTPKQKKARRKNQCRMHKLAACRPTY